MEKVVAGGTEVPLRGHVADHFILMIVAMNVGTEDIMREIVTDIGVVEDIGMRFIIFKFSF